MTDDFTLEKAAAQAFVSFLGGYETTAGSLQFAFYELTKNQNVEKKLRDEILNELNTYKFWKNDV